MFNDFKKDIMTITQPLTHPESSIPQNCCSSDIKSYSFQKTVDTICRIAIGVFAAAYAPVPFLISMHVGLLAGAVYAISRIYQSKPMLPEGENKPVCAQGYMDFLSGMKFPPPAGTLATAVFIAAHTRHDPLFYSPFCGLFIGFWLGRQGMISARDMAGRVIHQLIAPPAVVSHACCRNKRLIEN